MEVFQKTLSTIENISFGPLPLSSGEIIEEVTLQYERVGPIDAPVILVCHALTGNHITVGTHDSPGWWHGLIGQQKYIDTEKFQVITFNVLGGCDGSTGPSSINPETDEIYQTNFPSITIRDMVHAQYQALKKLGIKNLAAIIGGSLGGMQVLEWGILYPTAMEKSIVLAATPFFSDYGIAFNHIALSAIKNDSVKGLELARMIGMVTYRSSSLFTDRFNREKTNSKYEVSSYLDYQGQKLAQRFDPTSYSYLLQAMNGHDIGEYRGGWQQASKEFKRPLLAISFENDLIYEPHHIRALTEFMPTSSYHHVQTNFGHDGFLTEFEKWGEIVQTFIEDPRA
ncbi:homoserine O-acetyltransferase MetX [Virgibacillus necropolis]|uniref:Homoserine O-acetyltransferase n=1 Tax=Virgibacillus necropolis TaxID=163877 RepID=A0A221MHL8_9BACI|nr:homoserine O-acetyltransferase [Virgibacillus necropolis]ASN07136.1 homoserine O-acetyltransferase [Virgibacillus necropolis]